MGKDKHSCDEFVYHTLEEIDPEMNPEVSDFYGGIRRHIFPTNFLTL